MKLWLALVLFSGCRPDLAACKAPICPGPDGSAELHVDHDGWEDELGTAYTFTFDWGDGGAVCEGELGLAPVLPCDNPTVVADAWRVEGHGEVQGAWVEIRSFEIAEFVGYTTLIVERDGQVVAFKAWQIDGLVYEPTDCGHICTYWVDTVTW